MRHREKNQTHMIDDTQLALVGSQSDWGTEINMWVSALKAALGGETLSGATTCRTSSADGVCAL